MEMSALLNKMVIFVVLMVIGYVCARRGMLSPAGTKAASSLTMNVFMVGTILHAVFAAEIDLDLAALLRLLLIICASQVVSFLVAALVSRLLPMREEHRSVFELLLAMGNNIFIALPVLEVLYGPVAVFYCSLVTLPFNLYAYSYGIWRLKSGNGERKLRLRDVLSTPLLASIAALLIILLRPPIPAVVRSLASAMAGATMPLSMIVIGASLSSVSLLDAFRNGKLYIMNLFRLLVIPLLVWVLGRLVVDDPVLLMSCVVMAASPSAVMVTVLTVQCDRDAVFSAEGVLQSTALSMLTIPLLVWLLAA